MTAVGGLPSSLAPPTRCGQHVWNTAACNGWYLRPDSETVATHTAMDGGKFHIPDQELPMLYAAIVLDANMGQPGALVERVPDDGHFNMFVDMDFKHLTPVQRQNIDISDVVLTIHDAVCTGLPRRDGNRVQPTMHIAESRGPDAYFEAARIPNQALEEDDDDDAGGDGDKYERAAAAVDGQLAAMAASAEENPQGVHIVWEATPVDTNSAYVFLRYIMRSLAMPDVPEKDWAQVLDDTVYTSGLRMLFQSKGANTAGRHYVYAACKKANRDLNMGTTMLAPEAQLASMNIRPAGIDHAAASAPTSKKRRAPASSAAAAAAAPMMRNKRSATAKERTDVARKQTLGGLSSEDRTNLLSETDPRYLKLYACLRSWMGHDVKATGIIAKKSMYVVWTDRKMCTHYGKEHQRKTQYLRVFPRRVVQVCSCKCVDKGCAQWKGYTFAPERSLNALDRQVLFPKGDQKLKAKDQKIRFENETTRNASAGIPTNQPVKEVVAIMVSTMNRGKEGGFSMPIPPPP